MRASGAHIENDGTFSVSKAPKTADSGSLVVWIVLFLLMALAVALVFFLLKRSGRLGGGKRTSGKKNSRKDTLRYPSGKEYVRRPASEVIPDLDFDPEPVEDDAQFDTAFGVADLTSALVDDGPS